MSQASLQIEELSPTPHTFCTWLFLKMSTRHIPSCPSRSRFDRWLRSKKYPIDHCPKVSPCPNRWSRISFPSHCRSDTGVSPLLRTWDKRGVSQCEGHSLSWIQEWRGQLRLVDERQSPKLGVAKCSMHHLSSFLNFSKESQWCRTPSPLLMFSVDNGRRGKERDFHTSSLEWMLKTTMVWRQRILQHSSESLLQKGAKMRDPLSQSWGRLQRTFSHLERTKR